MRYEIFISLRYLLAKRKERFISVISLISILGVAVGVACLIVVIAVMSGFDNDLRDKIVGTNSHILVESGEGIEDVHQVMERINGTEHVLASSPFINGQGMMRVGDRVVSVVVRGIDPALERRVTEIYRYLVEGDLVTKDKGIIIGRQLSERLNLKTDDSVSIISPIDTKLSDFRISGIFNSGMYEYDSSLVFMGLRDAQEFFDAPSHVSGIGVRIDNIYMAEKVKRDIQQRIGFPYWVRTWMDVNRNLFQALKLEKTVMFIILALIIVVACFNIISTLIMVVMEKTKDIGILKSIGATNRGIMAIFTLQGLIIGITGTLTGAAGGMALSFLLKTYPIIKLPSDIYSIDRLPVDVQWNDAFYIILASISISLVSTLYPSWQASRLNPVEALRYE
ncbi:MAG: lipoprotein-releasing ABC transporter permease subunit [Candidatus Omnitrophica bacterium]|nr:lipoprotein-releasing ABC transporter permease subunit [Candidatus Omnitrophota bacterium]